MLSHWANDGVIRHQYAVASVVWSLPFGEGHQLFAGTDLEFSGLWVGGR